MDTTRSRWTMDDGLRRRNRGWDDSENSETKGLLCISDPEKPKLAMGTDRAQQSFERRVFITFSRVLHCLAYICRGTTSYFIDRLHGISNFCAVYAFTGMLFTLLVGTMIKDQPLFIKGVDETNQELMKESAFGAMGMFTFIFTSSVIYQCLHRNKNDEDTIRCQGYMRPSHQMAMSDYQVEMPHAYSYRDDPGNIVHHSDGEEDGGDETEEDDEGETAHQEIDLLS